MLAAFLLAHLAALVAWWRFTGKESNGNAADFKANGSADDLKAGYHQRRTNIRALVAAPLALLPPLLLWRYGPGPVACVAAGTVALLAGYFVRAFTPALNLAQGLDYKKRFYASPASASFPDANIWRYVRRRHPGQPDAVLQDEADAVNHHLLNYLLAGGIVLYLALLATGFYHALV